MEEKEKKERRDMWLAGREVYERLGQVKKSVSKLKTCIAILFTQINTDLIVFTQHIQSVLPNSKKTAKRNTKRNAIVDAPSFSSVVRSTSSTRTATADSISLNGSSSSSSSDFESVVKVYCVVYNTTNSKDTDKNTKKTHKDEGNQS